MRISFERTGGFAGPAARKTCTVDTETLEANLAQELQRLVHAAQFFSLPGKAEGHTAARDAFRYQVRVESEAGQHAVDLPEAAVPDKLRPLIAWLLNHCADPGRNTGRAEPGDG